MPVAPKAGPGKAAWTHICLTFGAPVVPEVYMMVQMSLGPGLACSAGLTRPSSRNLSQVNTSKPAAFTLCFGKQNDASGVARSLCNGAASSSLVQRLSVIT